MKLSSLLSIYNGPDAKYDAKHILFALNDFVNEDSPLSSRFLSEDYLLCALSHAFGIELRPSLRGRMSVSVVNYRFYDDVDLVLKGCCTELKIVVQ